MAWHQVARLLDPAALSNALVGMRQQIIARVPTMPAHAAYLGEYCPALPAA